MQLSVDVHQASYGATPIDPDHFEFLLPKYQGLKTLSELYDVEAENIVEAELWLEDMTPTVDDVLDQVFLRDLHRRMFGDVWSWAGQLRARETNIGVAPTEISTQWEQILQNTLWQFDNDGMSPGEAGLRFHRRTLEIHCFTNGNGRHARIAANALLSAAGHGPEYFTWGQRTMTDPEQARREYIDSLNHADRTDDFTPLLTIARS